MEKTSVHIGVFANTVFSQELFIEIKEEYTAKPQIVKMTNIPSKGKTPNSYYEIEVPLTQNFTYIYGMSNSKGKEQMITKDKNCYKEDIMDYRRGTLLNPFIEDEFGIIEPHTIIKLSGEPYIGKIIAIYITTSEIKPNSIVMSKYATANSYKKCTPEQLYLICVKLLDCLNQKETARICCNNIECAQVAYCILPQYFSMLKGDENDFEEAINSTLKSCINLEKDSLFYKSITENKEAIKLMASKWINMSE